MSKSIWNIMDPPSLATSTKLAVKPYIWPSSGASSCLYLSSRSLLKFSSKASFLRLNLLCGHNFWLKMRDNSPVELASHLNSNGIGSFFAGLIGNLISNFSNMSGSIVRPTKSLELSSATASVSLFCDEFAFWLAPKTISIL